MTCTGVGEREKNKLFWLEYVAKKSMSKNLPQPFQQNVKEQRNEDGNRNAVRSSHQWTSVEECSYFPWASKWIVNFIRSQAVYCAEIFEL